MADRELLELAAKAAGLDLGKAQDTKWFYCDRGQSGPGMYLVSGNLFSYWNPLTDDGDALRLAVELGIDIEWRADGRVAAYRHANANGYCFTAFESSREDRQENTRRAIVRAAAEIGKAMENGK